MSNGGQALIGNMKNRIGGVSTDSEKILMLLIGAVALCGSPVSQYPGVVPPTVQVTTNYPGASARTLMDRRSADANLDPIPQKK